MAEAGREWRLSGTRVAWASLAGLVVAHVVLAILLFDPKPFIGGDNAGYMILAESLESGRGYHDIYLPGAPIHAQYPPFYPALLALARLLGGDLITYKVLSAVCTAAAVVFFSMLARKRLGWNGGLAVTIPFALSPVLLYYSHWVLSEAPFVLLTVIALWAAERMTESPRWLAVALITALLAYLTRAAGLPLLVALLASLGWRRLWRGFAVAGGAALVVVGGWWLWGRLAADRSAEIYSSNFLLVDPYAPASGYVGPAQLLGRVINNVRLYSVDILPDSLAGQAPGVGVGLLALLTALLVIALAIGAWVRDVRRARALELFTALYAGLIFLWPDVWADKRFLLPLLPVLFLHAAAGVIWCFEFVQAKRPAWALPVLAAFLCLLAVPHYVRAASSNRHCLKLYREGDTAACYPPQWRAFFETAVWARENTPEDAVIITRKPRLFYLISGRRGDVYPFTSDDDEMLAFLDEIGADYVVVASLSQTTYEYLVPVVRAVPERFEPVYSTGVPATPAYVLEYHSGRGE